ncbi:MAG TPA: VOC family protein [Thermoleophilaceae bacterium]|nr:VOC family protein [Thermoleophilaceae bacterium]
MVPARLTVVTIGARDLARLRDFYAALGWQLAIELDDLAAFRLRGAVLVLYPLDRLAADANLEAAPSQPGLRGFNPAVNVDEIDQVDEAIETARAAGARISREPHTADWGGRTGYFLDPEDNLWEVAWVPPDSRMAALVRAAVTP